MSHNLIVTCAFGLESVVKRELIDLGHEPKVIRPGWVAFSGTESDLIRANLCLRTADRILIQVLNFEAPDFDSLFETTRDFDWSRYIPGEARFPVRGRSIQSQLSSVPAIQRSVKKAIVESLQRNLRTNELPETGPEFPIEIAIRKNEACVTLDTTGASLHKRGYRKLVGPAPLKETLAAAMVLLSVWNPSRPLIDPFCGSGTIAIEAAMIARNIAPGIGRQYVSEDWNWIDGKLWRELREELESSKLTAGDPGHERILATDIDPEVLSLARYHARRAGVDASIHFQQRAFEDLRSSKEFGCIITNPPYGERLESRDLNQLYRSVPRVLQRLPTWSHFILTAVPRFEAVIQQSATRRRKLYNGRIECVYYQYLGPRPPSNTNQKTDIDPVGDVAEIMDSTETDSLQNATADPRRTAGVSKSSGEATKPSSDRGIKPESPAGIRPVFGGISERTRHQAELFSSRLQKRARHLRRWPKRGITCYRIYEKDIPEIPLVVDRYEDYLHVVEFERPHDHDLAEHASWQELMCQTAAKALNVPIQRVAFKERHRQRDFKQHEKIHEKDNQIVVNEGGLKFLVNLTDYADTGLFLDHRITREFFRREAAGKRVLNLFGYTGAFTVYAAAGGARSVLHVDSSATYNRWAERNLELNGLRQPGFVFRTMDAVALFDELPESGLFDLAIVDPPTFSNSHSRPQAWEVQRDHVQLLRQLSRRMPPGGTVFFSTNFRRFKLDNDVESFFTEVREISRQTVPEDFRNRRIHRCWRMVV